MNILKYIANLYKGNENKIIQPSIFALVGIMAISLNGVFSVFTGNAIYAIFTTPSNNEIITYSMLGIMIFIYFMGYTYNYINGLFRNDNEIILPSVSLNCFTTFVKTLPITLVWGIYYAFFCFMGLCLFRTKISEGIFIVLTVLILPYINMIIVKFAKDFKYSREIFNPLLIFKLIKNTFLTLYAFIIQFVIICTIITFLTTLMFKYSIEAPSRTLQLVCVLLSICVSSYIQQILNFAYYQGIVKILKNKLNE